MERDALMDGKSLRNFIYIFIVIFFYKIDGLDGHLKGTLTAPHVYTAYTDDLNVTFKIDEFETTTNGGDQPLDLKLQIYRIDDTKLTSIAILDIFINYQTNVTHIIVPCGLLLRGGVYELEIVDNNSYLGNNNLNSTSVIDLNIKHQLDVRWPVPQLKVTPESIWTYPQEPLSAILEYPENKCLVPKEVATDKNQPEFWLELLYCGHEVYCNSENVSASQQLYKEEVRGFPNSLIITLRCDLFGLAGHYIFKLKPIGNNIPSYVTASAYVKADWSEQFVFNVHTRSIFPCDPHTGIKVLFEYPACILDQADRVRLFAKQRADVASLAPPTTLHYVTEQRVIRGHHSLHFECDLFSEKYVEYCFVYVSQAITNAVADVRMDCVPTLPVSDLDTGGWGPWSQWTPCSTTCAGGTRNRYRFCDSPPPRYGAKFCEGSAVETQRCGGPISGTWDCIYGAGSGNIPADRPEVIAEIGPGCRCGCIVHLGLAKPRRLIASSSKSCPGRTFWLIQADDGDRIRFKFDFFHLPCTTQWLKIRDGDSLTSELIGYFIGGNPEHPSSIVSLSSQILVEFFSDELESTGQACGGGFLAHAQQMQVSQNLTVIAPSKAVMSSVRIAPIAMHLTLAHIFVILFISIIIVISLLLGVQYIFRYRKYQLAESMGEPDSPAHTPGASLASLNGGARRASQPPSRAISTTTLISEVISLVKLRPRGGNRVKHSRLRESVDVETAEKIAQGDEGNGDEDDDDDEVGGKSHSDDDDITISSTHTLTNEILNDLENPKRKKKLASPSSTATGDDGGGNDTMSSEEGDLGGGRGNVSGNTSSSQSGGDNSPPSNASISLPPTPSDTPTPHRKYGKFDTKSLNGKSTIKRGKIRDVSPVREEDGGESTSSDMAHSGRLKTGNRRKVLSASNATLTNVRGCYSPALSLTSTATIRTNNPKESKEKQNREKLLAGPGSEFSLANPEDLELDYYDYNVINAGAAPGSYLGMDPAYLVWIPPIDDGNIINEVENEMEPHYEEILPHHGNIDPGSNTETPENEIQPELPPPNKQQSTSKTNPGNRTLENMQMTKKNYLNDRKDATSGMEKTTDEIQLHDLSSSKNFLNRKLSSVSATPSATSSIHSTPVTAKKLLSKKEATKNVEHEKETTVVKSPSDNISDYYELDDIQFVDDDDDELDFEDQCIREVHGKNLANELSKNGDGTVRGGGPLSKMNSSHMKT